MLFRIFKYETVFSYVVVEATSDVEAVEMTYDFCTDEWTVYDSETDHTHLEAVEDDELHIDERVFCLEGNTIARIR